MKKKSTNQSSATIFLCCIERLLLRKRKVFSFILLQLVTISAFSQTIVTGTIRDQKGETLPGVTVKLKANSQVNSSTAGVSSDSFGKYSISIPDLNSTLIFSFIGMQTKEVAISGRSVVDVVLGENVATLNEVVVIGFGSQSRETVTTSISKLDTKVLENIPFSNAAAALQGTVSGVRVQSTSGQPGAAPRIMIRGGTSIENPNGSAPLYLIDGVIRASMNDINSDDIESLQILKDAAATSIYGARASNGVVIITTKSGKPGKSQISYNTDVTLSNVVNDYDPISAKDFIYYQRMGIAAIGAFFPADLNQLSSATSAGTGNDLTNRTAYTTQYLSPANQHKLNEGWQSMPDPVDPTKTIIFQETNFQDILFRQGISQNHSISASGGVENATFNLGVGYLTSEGVAIKSDYNRLSLNFNGDLKIKDNFKAFGRLLYSNSRTNAVDGSNIFSLAQGPPRTTKRYFEDGTLAPGAAGSGSAEYLLNTFDRKSGLSDLTMAIGGNWNILPGLSFNPQVSLFTNTADGRSFTKAYFNGPTNFVNTRNASGTHSKRLQTQADAVLSYKKLFSNVHNIDVTAGFSYFGTQSTSLSASGRGAASDLIPTLNASAQPISVSGSESEQIVMGYFGRINYDFNQKYLLSLNIRYDGASNLGKSHKWGMFPGVSLGWNVHKENFWKVFPENFAQLKLRGSYGVNGNISGLGPYQAQGQYSVGALYGGAPAVVNTILANPELKWEESVTLNGGFDLGLFNNRVSILFDTYRRETKNLITGLTLPHSTGFASVLTNLGTFENKGVEVELSASVLSNSSPLRWDVAFNASKVKSKILKLPNNNVENNRVGGIYVWDPNRGDYAWLGGLQEGGRVGDLFAYKQVGVYSTNAEAAKAPLDEIIPGVNKTKYGGDVNWMDLDGDGKINANDRMYMGNMFPTLTGGFTNSLSYKNISFTARLDYTTGHTIYNYRRASTVGQFSGNEGLSSELLRSWQKEGDITDIPKFYWADKRANNIIRGNSEYYESGDYLALREVTLAYNFPVKYLQKLKISSLRFNVTGHNLHYFTKYKGVIPEDGDTDMGRYPMPRNIIFGAKIIF